MKKTLFLLTLGVLVLVLILAACAGKASKGTPPTGGNNSNLARQSLTLPAQMLVGTFKLEGTANAVDAKEAAALLPLWQAYTQLISSNTTAQAEIDSVVSQIQNTMTPQQTQAITGMKLTMQDEITTMSSLGLVNFQLDAKGISGFSGTPNTSGGDNGSGSVVIIGGGAPSSGSKGGGGGGNPSNGVFISGGGDGGLAGPVGGVPINPSQSGTPQAIYQATGANLQVPPPLLNALIDLLQKKAQQ